MKLLKWKLIAKDTYRLKTKKGYIVAVADEKGRAMCYVPEEDWHLK